MEFLYLWRISEIMDTGLTFQQANEKIYQDLISKGDLEGAEALRRYQDVIHHRKNKRQKPPLDPEPPSNP